MWLPAFLEMSPQNNTDLAGLAVDSEVLYTVYCSVYCIVQSTGYQSMVESCVLLLYSVYIVYTVY